jgi:hypothetical protein
VLGALCDTSSVDRLTQFAHALAVPGAPDEERLVALNALYGLAAIHPADLRDRIAPLLSRQMVPSVRADAEHALALPGVCR